MSVVNDAAFAVSDLESACVTVAARVQTLTDEIDDLKGCLVSVIAQRDEARAEVERLRAEAAPMNEHFNAGYRDGYRDAYRRGAEAMREACAQWVDDYVSSVKARAIRALPIPEEP